MVKPMTIEIIKATNKILPRLAGRRRREIFIRQLLIYLVSKNDLRGLDAFCVAFGPEDGARAFPGHVDQFAIADVNRPAAVGGAIKSDVGGTDDGKFAKERKIPLITTRQKRLCRLARFGKRQR